MIELLKNLAMLYGAFFVVFFLHELGHIPTRGIKIKSWFPIPMMYAREGFSRIGGLMVNLALIIGIAHYKPEMMFIQLVGAIAFVHLIYYFIVGSFYPEPHVPKSQWKFVVFDDVDNGLWYLFVPGAILIAYIYGPYYLEIIKTFIGGLV